MPHQMTATRTLSTASKLAALSAAAPAAMLMAPGLCATHAGAHVCLNDDTHVDRVGQDGALRLVTGALRLVTGVLRLVTGAQILSHRAQRRLWPAHFQLMQGQPHTRTYMPPGLLLCTLLLDLCPDRAQANSCKEDMLGKINMRHRKLVDQSSTQKEDADWEQCRPRWHSHCYQP